MNIASSTLLTILAVGGSILLGACSDDPVQPGPNPVPAAVELNPESITLTAIGETETVEVTVLDEDGIEIPDPVVTWTTSDDDVVLVDEDGVIEAVGGGAATITATSGDVSGSVEVMVELGEEGDQAGSDG